MKPFVNYQAIYYNADVGELSLGHEHSSVKSALASVPVHSTNGVLRMATLPSGFMSMDIILADWRMDMFLLMTEEGASENIAICFAEQVSEHMRDTIAKLPQEELKVVRLVSLLLKHIQPDEGYDWWGRVIEQYSVKEFK